MAEPEWDDESRALAIAYNDVDLCPSCGGPAYLCQDPELQEQWKAEPPVRCHRTTAILRAQKSMTEETNPQLGALLWRAVLDEA